MDSGLNGRVKSVKRNVISRLGSRKIERNDITNMTKE